MEKLIKISFNWYKKFIPIWKLSDEYLNTKSSIFLLYEIN